jgi:two-component system response regulator
MNKVILLVEDNASDEKLTVLALKKSGVSSDIIVARDGAAALEYVFRIGKHADRDTSPRPTVVLLDLQLPKVGGLEVLRRIRADDRTKLLPVVILTASKEEEDILKSYSFGANGYVRKPIDFDEFGRAAETLGRFWLLLNESLPPSA